MTSNNLEAIELLKTCVERLQDQGFSSHGNTVSELNKAIDLLQADEDIEVKEEPPFKFECRHPDCKAKPTKLDKEEVWKKAQAAAKTFEKPTKETKLRELQDKLVLEKTQWRMALSELIDILLEEEY